MIIYEAVVKWRGDNHPVQKHKHARRGMKFPATQQLRPRPNRGKKIQWRYYNDRMRDLLYLNGWYGFWVIRGIGRFLFNRGGANGKWNRAWKIFRAAVSRIPYPIPNKPNGRPQFAVAEGIVCDGNIVPVAEVRGRWCRLEAPFIAQLNEVEIGTGRRFSGGLRWYVYPDDKSGQVWIEKQHLIKL